MTQTRINNIDEYILGLHEYHFLKSRINHWKKRKVHSNFLVIHILNVKSAIHIYIKMVYIYKYIQFLLIKMECHTRKQHEHLRQPDNLTVSIVNMSCDVTPADIEKKM